MNKVRVKIASQAMQPMAAPSPAQQQAMMQQAQQMAMQQMQQMAGGAVALPAAGFGDRNGEPIL